MRYALREALAAFRRAPITVLAAVMVGLALFVIGLFSLAAHNLEEALRGVESRVEVVVYLRDDVLTSEIELAQAELAALPEVLDVRYVSKEAALENARRDLSDLEGVFADLTVNPLPASLEIRLEEEHRTRESVADISAAAADYPFVEDVVPSMSLLRTSTTSVPVEPFTTTRGFAMRRSRMPSWPENETVPP